MAKVVVLTTGGTIASVRNKETGLYASGAMAGEKLIDTDRLQLNIDIEVESVFQVPSNAMDTEKLALLHDKIMLHTAKDDVLGIVVTHGTDTLEESSYYMDLIYTGDKAVVFTGAQRTPDEEGTDAFTNIRDSIITAACPDCRGLGVLVTFNEGVFSASRVHKGHAYKVHTFSSPDYGQLGFVDKGKCWIRQRPASRKTYALQENPPRVELVKACLGSDGRCIRLLCDDGAKGIVIEGLGRGHVSPVWMEHIHYATSKGVAVVVTTTCGQGRVHPVYNFQGSVASLVAEGVIMGHDYAPLKARIRLMVLLGAGITEPHALQEAFDL